MTLKWYWNWRRVGGWGGHFSQRRSWEEQGLRGAPGRWLWLQHKDRVTVSYVRAKSAGSIGLGTCWWFVMRTKGATEDLNTWEWHEMILSFTPTCCCSYRLKLTWISRPWHQFGGVPVFKCGLWAFGMAHHFPSLLLSLQCGDLSHRAKLLWLGFWNRLYPTAPSKMGKDTQFSSFLISMITVLQIVATYISSTPWNRSSPTHPSQLLLQSFGG